MKTEIKERPMLFSAPMVRAILDGGKTQTRRTNGFEWTNMSMPDMWDKVEIGFYGNDLGAWFRFDDQGINRDTFVKCPYGKVGDRLWVRETFQYLFADGFDHDSSPYPDQKTGEGYNPSYPATDGIKEYVDGDDLIVSKCTPSIHMPRWASRINLEITAVRVERLNDISETDAWAEGIECEPCDQTVCFKNYMADNWIPAWGDTFDTAAILSFESLWESINGSGSWQQNPWVWVIEFKRV